MKAIEVRAAEAVRASLSPDVTFINPVTFLPFKGLETRAFAVPKVLEVWQGPHCVADVHGDGLVELEPRAGIRGERRIDLLRFGSDGRVAERSRSWSAR